MGEVEDIIIARLAIVSFLNRFAKKNQSVQLQFDGTMALKVVDFVFVDTLWCKTDELNQQEKKIKANDEDETR